MWFRIMLFEKLRIAEQPCYITKLYGIVFGCQCTVGIIAGTKIPKPIVAKCALVIDILSNARRPLGLKEITESSGMVKSSAHRILSVLLSEELVENEYPSRAATPQARIERA